MAAKAQLGIPGDDGSISRNNAKPALPWSVEMVPLHRPQPAKCNPRTHSKRQIREIANSIERFGVMNPIIADDRDQIIAGHARARTAQLVGLQRIPVIRVSHLNQAEIRAYLLADNKLAAKAGWDREALAIEIQDLQVVLPEIGLDLGITGFDPAEIDSIMLDFADRRKDSADELPEVKDEGVSRGGDLYVMGNHRLLVGDARDPQAFKLLMQGNHAEMAFLDPPYNVRIAGHVGGRGRIKHREFAFASGEMTSAQFIEFLRETLGLAAQHTVDGAISYICMDWRHIGELLEAGAAVFDELKNLCVWVKTSAGQGSFYRNQHELILVYKRGGAPHINTFELGQHGRSRTNVWNYQGVNTFRAGRMDDLGMHPTVKPVALVSDAMRDCSRRGSIVLDVFAGSGTTIVAAEQIGRRAHCMEIDPRYADAAIRRYPPLSAAGNA